MKTRPVYRMPWFKRVAKTWYFSDGHVLFMPFFWRWDGKIFRFDGIHYNYGPVRVYHQHRKPLKVRSK